MPQQPEAVEHDQQACGIGGGIDTVELRRVTADPPAHAGAGLGVGRPGLRSHATLEPGFGKGNGASLGFR